MPSKNKVRGNALEYEIVAEAKKHGLDAIRAWGSNGAAIGEAETVDCKVDGIRIQAKRRKKLAAFLQVPEGADYVVFREDHAKPSILIPFSEWCHARSLLKEYEKIIKELKEKLYGEKGDSTEVPGL